MNRATQTIEDALSKYRFVSIIRQSEVIDLLLDLRKITDDAITGMPQETYPRKPKRL